MRKIRNGLSLYGGNFEFSRQTGCCLRFKEHKTPDQMQFENFKIYHLDLEI